MPARLAISVKVVMVVSLLNRRSAEAGPRLPAPPERPTVWASANTSMLMELGSRGSGVRRFRAPTYGRDPGLPFVSPWYWLVFGAPTPYAMLLCRMFRIGGILALWWLTTRGGGVDGAEPAVPKAIPTPVPAPSGVPRGPRCSLVRAAAEDAVLVRRPGDRRAKSDRIVVFSVMIGLLMRFPKDEVDRMLFWLPSSIFLALRFLMQM